MNSHLPFPVLSNSIPYITTKQMIEVDRLMIEEYGINLFQMMENAGRCLAIVTGKLINYNKDKNILVIAGSGGNGGGGMTAARRLYFWGYKVMVLLTSGQEKYSGIIGHQLNILKNTNVKINEMDNFDFNANFDIVIDAMIGYSLRGKLRKNIIKLIQWTNELESNIISLDVPSGLDSTTGEIISNCIEANYTMTLALPKTGFQNPKTKEHTGQLLLADISVPPVLYKNVFDIDLSDIFNNSDIVIISQTSPTII